MLVRSNPHRSGVNQTRGRPQDRIRAREKTSRPRAAGDFRRGSHAGVELGHGSLEGDGLRMALRPSHRLKHCLGAAHRITPGKTLLSWVALRYHRSDRPFGLRGRTNVTEPWLSADDIASHLGVTKDTVYAWIAEKGMPAHKIGRLWKFQASEVDDWVRRGGAAAPEEPKPS